MVYIIPMLLSTNPMSRNKNVLSWKIAVATVSLECEVWARYYMISTSQADLPWGHRAESCFNYPGFPLSHCHCEAPGATLPCIAESTYRGGYDNSDNGSACSKDASALWHMGSWINLTVSLILSLLLLVCSPLFSLLSERVHEISQWLHERKNM